LEIYFDIIPGSQFNKLDGFLVLSYSMLHCNVIVHSLFFFTGPSA
jgi:hypothetical protein